MRRKGSEKGEGKIVLNRNTAQGKLQVKPPGRNRIHDER